MQVGFVLQQQSVSRFRLINRIHNKFAVLLHIRTRSQHDGVLASGIDIDHRVTRRLIRLAQIFAIHTIAFDPLTDPAIALANRTDVKHLGPRFRCGNGLVHPFAAEAECVIQRAQGFSGFGKMGKLVEMVDIHRTEIKDCHKRPPTMSHYVV